MVLKNLKSIDSALMVLKNLKLIDSELKEMIEALYMCMFCGPYLV